MPVPEKNPDLVDNVYDWIEVFVYSVAFVILLFTFCVRLAVVDGESMTNTLQDRDILVISNLGYTPSQGDIVVFQSKHYPEPIVKRVIATAGQTVNINFETWKVTVDGEPVDEAWYVRRDDLMSVMHRGDVSFPHVVPEGCVFCMGDNRNGSTDSRWSSIGDVDTRFVLGHVLLRVFPFDGFGVLPAKNPAA